MFARDRNGLSVKSVATVVSDVSDGHESVDCSDESDSSETCLRWNWNKASSSLSCGKASSFVLKAGSGIMFVF